MTGSRILQFNLDLVFKIQLKCKIFLEIPNTLSIFILTKTGTFGNLKNCVSLNRFKARK